jgi:hypothetical protein
MTLIGLLGSLAIAFIAFSWAAVKLSAYAVKSDSETPMGVLKHVVGGWKLLVVSILIIEIGPGVGSWLYDVFGVFSGVIANA